MFLSFRFATFLFLLLALTLPAVSQANYQQPGTATVTGMVRLGGEPAAGIAMAMIPEQTGGPGRRQPNQPQQGQQTQEDKTFQATTDANGIYRFTAVPAGRYRVMPLTETLVSASGNPNGTAISISVSEGQAVSQIDFSMARGGVITGRVIDGNNRPVIAERITLSTVTETGQSRQVNGGNRFGLETDDRGIYRAYGLPAGRYLVSAGTDAAGLRPGPAFNRRAIYAKTFHPNATEESEAQIIEVAAGSVSENVNIQLGLPAKTYAVSGRAVDSKTGQPVQSVPISVTREARNGRGGQAGFPTGNVSSTNAEGEFRITGLFPGRYSVSVNPANFAGGTAVTNEFYSEPTSFEISSDDASGVELQVNQGAAIAGIVAIEGTNDPTLTNRLSQLMVFANSRGGQRQAGGQGGGQASGQGGATSGGNGLSSVSPAGIFRVGGLAPGTFRLNINGGGGGFGGGGAFKLIRIERNGSPINGDVEVTSGEQISGIRIVVGYGSAVIQGRVLVNGAPPPAGLRIMVSARSANSTAGNGGGGNQRVEADGQFRIENLLPGAYEIRATGTVAGGPGGRGQGGRQGRGGQAGVPAQPQTTIQEDRQTVTATNGQLANVTLNLKLVQQ